MNPSNFQEFISKAKDQMSDLHIELDSEQKDIKIVINGLKEIKELELAPDLLVKGSNYVSQTVMNTINQAYKKADEEISKQVLLLKGKMERGLL